RKGPARRPPHHGSVRDAELAAVAEAGDAAAIDLRQLALHVGARRREGAKLPGGWLGDDRVTVRQDDAAANRDVGCGEVAPGRWLLWGVRLGRVLRRGRRVRSSGSRSSVLFWLGGLVAAARREQARGTDGTGADQHRPPRGALSRGRIHVDNCVLARGRAATIRNRVVVLRHLDFPLRGHPQDTLLTTRPARSRFTA